MQLMIDTATDDAATIRKAIRMLQALIEDAPAAPIGNLGDIVLVDGKAAKLSVVKLDDVPEPPSNVVNFPKPPAAAPTAEAPPPPPPLIPSPPPPNSGTLAAAAVPPLAPVATAPVVVPSSQAPEFDSAGVPFDARIHQKKRSKKTDGSWKLQKGIDPAVVQSVISELSASGKMRPLDAPNPPSATPPSSAATPGPVGVFGKSPLPPGAEAPPPPPAANPAPPPPPASDAMPTVTFRTFVAKCAAATKEGKLTPQQIAGICQQHGAPTLMALNSMAHLIPDVNATLDAMLMMG